MRICKDHWSAMRMEIDRLGLSSFVAGSGEDAMARAERDLESHLEGAKPLVSDWDPLMAMNWNFCSRVMESWGLRIMEQRHQIDDGMPENGGYVCPLCVVRRDFDTHNTDTGRCGEVGCNIQVKPGTIPWDKNWIASCAESMMEYAVEQKLITRQ